MKFFTMLIAALMLSAGSATAAEKGRTNYPSPHAPDAPAAPLSKAVLAGKTLYISGQIGFDPATAKLAATPIDEAKFALDSIKSATEAAGMKMDDLVTVQIFCSDLTLYADFNKLYRSYFTGDMPARAFIGVDHLLGGAHFEIMGIAVKK